jgi:hypothetical protein
LRRLFVTNERALRTIFAATACTIIVTITITISILTVKTADAALKSYFPPHPKSLGASLKVGDHSTIYNNGSTVTRVTEPRHCW